MLKTLLMGVALAAGVGLAAPSTAEAGDFSIQIGFGYNSYHRPYYRTYRCAPRYYYREYAPRYYYRSSYPRYSYYRGCGY
ncbi:MAG: hypothetical protein ACREID_04630 [Planctomycetota bacterium]